MKRRRLLKALAAVPAAPALLAQQQQNNTPRPSPQTTPPADATTPPAPYNRTPAAAVELPKLETSVADEAGIMTPRFFTPAQFAALRKLSEVIMPKIGEAPGALEASAPEFLDFLLSQSPSDRQTLYKTGLDLLNAGARKKFSKPYAELAADEAGTLLAPLKEKWTFDPPADPLARFLWAAKSDIRTATMNSKEYTVAASSGRRGGGGMGLYWASLD
ncbi:MAG: gluconate 2-dehydrogenase subunit 3 family protein [Bryobacteraceae bacterium]|nr:gluconate 2-dehydrogenase subunit 3 family protein [Bryobacteraceae bacterium]